MKVLKNRCRNVLLRKNLLTKDHKSPRKKATVRMEMVSPQQPDARGKLHHGRSREEGGR
jgi:hypothetical protein